MYTLLKQKQSTGCIELGELSVVTFSGVVPQTLYNVACSSEAVLKALSQRSLSYGDDDTMHNPKFTQFTTENIDR